MRCTEINKKPNTAHTSNHRLLSKLHQNIKYSCILYPRWAGSRKQQVLIFVSPSCGIHPVPLRVGELKARPAWSRTQQYPKLWEPNTAVSPEQVDPALEMVLLEQGVGLGDLQCSQSRAAKRKRNTVKAYVKEENAP